MFKHLHNISVPQSSACDGLNRIDEFVRADEAIARSAACERRKVNQLWRRLSSLGITVDSTLSWSRPCNRAVRTHDQRVRVRAPVEKLERSFQHHRLVLVGCAPVGHTCIDHYMRVRCRMPSALRHSVEMNEHEHEWARRSHFAASFRRISLSISATDGFL
jgi:hypothetical protein